MAPLAPVITQIVPTTEVAPPDTPVADLTQPPGETDPGPFTYAFLNGPNAMGEIQGNQIVTLVEVDGAYAVQITATSDPGGTSPATTETLIFGDNENPYDDTPDAYPGNPQFPPTLPAGATMPMAWDAFIVAATHAIVPNARNGVDFVVARPRKQAPMANVYWDDAVLGARPDAAIEAEAKRLAAEWPSGVLVTGTTEGEDHGVAIPPDRAAAERPGAGAPAPGARAPRA